MPDEAKPRTPALMRRAHAGQARRADTALSEIKDELLEKCDICNRPELDLLVFRRPGDYGEEPEPDPIPNSAVKLLSADGTLS